MAENNFLDSGVDLPEETPVSNGAWRKIAYGISFVGGMGLATVCNMSGLPGIAMGFGMVGLIGLVMFIGSLRTD